MTATIKIERSTTRPRGAEVTIDEPGEFAMIDKTQLNVDPSYQRSHTEAKIIKMANEWSWIACGAISVALRDNGDWYVRDGQHRVLAAMRRADIKELPCLLFDVTSVPQEARGFLMTNTHRKSMTAVNKFKALIMTGDPAAKEADLLIASSGRQLAAGGGASNFSAVDMLLQCIRRNERATREVWPVVVELCRGHRISSTILGGMWYLQQRLPNDSLSDAKWRKRILSVGLQEIDESMTKAAAFLNTTRGLRASGIGIANAINHGLRNKLQHTIRTDQSDDDFKEN